VKERDVAVEIDGLRADSKQPPSCGEGRGGGWIETAAGKDHRLVSERPGTPGHHLFCSQPCPISSLKLPSALTRQPLHYVFPRPPGHAVADRQTRTMDDGLLDFSGSHIRRLLLVSRLTFHPPAPS
jgi:hypothetical protein